MDIKYNILFFVEKEGSKEKGYKPDGKLRMRIWYASGKVDFNIGYRVYLEKWNTDTQRCKAGTTHGKKNISASEINQEVQRLESLAIDVFKTFEVTSLVPTISEYRDAFNTSNGKATSPDTTSDENKFFIHFNEFTKECGSQNDWTLSTYEKFSSIKNHLVNFDKNLSYDALHESKLTDYVNYLREQKNMRNSTIQSISVF